MVHALRSSLLVLALVFAFVLLHRAEGACRRSQDIECENGGHCIPRDSICNNQRDCPDGSDEDPTMCKIWPSRSGTCYTVPSRPFLYNGNCYSARDMCERDSSARTLNPKICEIVTQSKLRRQEQEMSTSQQQGINITSEVVDLLSSAVNSTLNYKAPDCAMLYTRVANDCVSFASYVKVSWAEARQFCRSIYGDLWHYTDLQSFGLLLTYMKEEQLTSDYWIGGRYDIDTNAWSWTTDDAAMPLGAPFWAVKREDSCVPRGPPHTDPFSDPPAALPGAPCYRNVLTPKKRASGWCSAMTYEQFYYWSDETCTKTFSPLCIFTGPAAPRQPVAH